jgi:hypothetical protein
VTLANLIGTALGMVLMPILIEQISIPTVQLICGAVAAFSAVLFIIHPGFFPGQYPSNRDAVRCRDYHSDARGDLEQLDPALWEGLGSLFFYVMAAIQTAGGSYTPSMVLAMALLVLSLLIVTQLKDPQLEQD